MKQFLIAMAAIALSSCTNTETKVAGSSDKHIEMANKNTDKIKAVYRAIETGEVNSLDTIIADDVVDHNANPDGSDLKGRENVKKMLADFHTYWDNPKFEYVSDGTSTDGEYQFALVRMTGKYTAKNPWGVPAGTDMDDTGVDVVKIKDGKATDHWSFLSWKDISEMMKQQGGNMPPMADTTGKKK